ncbi:hypothetical protein BDZ94DRAFT_1301884 [Collybia nuda]|uniref:protein-tyrosine-phosphatase n=1 Tax=Collybia nuda TaxID=64659 RepID=A0A9P5XXN3_9AGAR|nr:hypothetical protein BDZ94DRAFT_1301884 [Collybia nuda]
MDFFSAVRDGDQRPAPTDTDDVDAFAKAIAQRYGPSSSPSIVLTARLTPDHADNHLPRRPPPLNLPFPSSPMAKMTLAPRPAVAVPSIQLPPSFTPVPPICLPDYIDDTATLIIDIRPHAAHSSARIPHALSLSVPSTLLKRPLFSLQRISTMLPSQSASARFSAWPAAARILVYDADAAAIPDSSNIHGLLRKFKLDGFSGELAWLQGGFQAVWRERRDLIDTSPPISEPDDDDDRPTNASPTPALRTKHLPMSAFSLSSTTAAAPPSKRNPNMVMSIPLPTSQPMARPAFNPFFDTIRQNTELSHGITERIPLRLPRRVRRRIADLPFRWLQEIARRAECAPRTHNSHHYHSHHHNHHNHRLVVSSSSSSSSSEDTSDSDTPDPAGVEEGTEALAMQFYRIELAEQRRLMGVMEHHSKESGRFVDEGITQASLTFPFSITAGVEKGAKNRYRHIWPFEHARVRLHPQSSEEARVGDGDGDDYVNASYVQPLGTTRRYIATQGPLPATFNDFWRLCWEQNVHVIVMLTREVEGSMVKCGSYWVDDGDEDREKKYTRTYGPLTLKLLKKEGLPGAMDLLDERERGYQTHEAPSAGGFFGVAAPQRTFGSHPHAAAFANSTSTRPTSTRRRKPITTIKRTFELSHARYPAGGVRRVVHLQYLEWPDMNVPDDARGVLELIKEVERAVEETWEEEKGGGLYPPPDENAKEAGSSGETVTPGKKRGGLDADVDAEKDTLDQSADTGRNIHTDGDKGGNEGTDARPGRSIGIGIGGVEVGRGEMAVHEKSGIARHALGCKERRPVLLHCSAGVGRTGGFIAVDAILDAVRREMRKGKSVDREVAGSEGIGREKVDDTMDVDEPEAGLVTVPLHVGGAPVGGGVAEGVGNRNVGGLVVHVPAVVMPVAGGDGVRTPMQVDEVPMDVKENRTGKEGGISTRKWAETVLDETGVGAGPVAVPRSSSSSSTSASALPSMSDSDDSGGRLGLESSSLGTSVSGTSEEEAAMKRSRAQGPLVSALHETPKEKPMDEPQSQVAEFRRGRDADNGSQPQQQHRTRTFSAPHHPHFRNRSIGSGIGSSPLASSSTPWFLGTRGRDAMGRRPFGGLAGNTTLSSDGEPPSRSMSPSADEGSASSSAPPQPRATGLLHPLSKSSPPILHTASSSPQDGAGYIPDSIVTSSFSQRSTTVDYKEPRMLHKDIHSPVRLSTYEEPIWEVVQDMREQRMSLCQSLRQYVFVHAAIIEGALMIVDEECEKEKEYTEKGDMDATVPVLGIQVSGNTGHEGYFSFGAQATTHLNFATPLPLALPPMAVARTTPYAYATPNDGSSVSSSTGKRGASPTELLKEGKKGEVLLSKRPSIKRKHLSEATRAPVPFQSHAPKSQSLGQATSTTPSSSGSVSGQGSHTLMLSTVPSSPPTYP